MIARKRAGIFLAVLLGSGCQVHPGGARVVNLRFSGYAGNPAETDLMAKLVTEFNRSHPGIHVGYEPVPSQYDSKLLAMLASHAAPDVFYLDAAQFEPLWRKHVLEPLDAFVARSRTTRRHDFVGSLVRAFSAKGHLYGIPKDFNTLALFYNKTLFDRAQQPYPDATWTLARLRRAAIALTRPQARPPQYGFALTDGDPDRYIPIAREFGAALFDARGDCTIASPAGIGALSWYAGLAGKDGCAVYPSEVGSSWTGDVFGRQQAAMVFEGGWLIPYLARAYPGVRYGTTELPAGPAGRSNFLFTVAYAMPKACRHKAAAWKLISYLTSSAAEAQVTFAVPSRKAASARYAEQHPRYRAILAGARYARPFAFGPEGGRVVDRLGEAVQKVFLGASSPRRALLAAAAGIAAIGGQ